MRLREISSCSCLTVLPGPAWVLLSKTYKPLFEPLYKNSTYINFAGNSTGVFPVIFLLVLTFSNFHLYKMINYIFIHIEECSLLSNPKDWFLLGNYQSNFLHWRFSSKARNGVFFLLQAKILFPSFPPFHFLFIPLIVTRRNSQDYDLRVPRIRARIFKVGRSFAQRASARLYNLYERR